MSKLNEAQARVVSYGGGTNSTAMLVEFFNRGIRPDLILFADTGAELPNTYEYVSMFSDWLTDHNMPEITTVQNDGKHPTLEGACIANNTLPSIAYGRKACSVRWKIVPQDKYVDKFQPAIDVWNNGGKVIKYIGYDFGEFHRARAVDSDKYELVYPMIDWGIDRAGCIDIIRAAGLPMPGKSSCFFCPSMKAHEIRWLKSRHPELYSRALAIEDAARPTLKTVKGLGRRYSWRDVGDADDAQLSMFAAPPPIDCLCFDGGE
jgi:hypothetical protein